MDERSAQRAFLQALLQWDYAAMFDKYEKGQGLVDELPKLGRTFSNVEVRSGVFGGCAEHLPCNKDWHTSSRPHELSSLRVVQRGSR